MWGKYIRTVRHVYLGATYLQVLKLIVATRAGQGKVAAVALCLGCSLGFSNPLGIPNNRITLYSTPYMPCIAALLAEACLMIPVFKACILLTYFLKYYVS